MKKWIIIFLIAVAVMSGLYFYIFQNGDSVLTISNCDLPCWNNITPGLTYIDDAKRILLDTPEVGASNIDRFDYKRTMRFHLFLEKPGINPEALCDVYYDEQGIVTEFQFFGKLTIKVEEILQKLGPPQYIVSTPYGGGGTVFVAVYPDVGVSFYLAHREKEVAPNTKIARLVLFNPSDYPILLDERRFSYLALSGEDTLAVKYLWMGYGKIDDLYPPRTP